MQKNLAFVFPGQGSQTVGMLADFADDAIVQETFKQASDALGYDVWQLISTDENEQLNKTEFTQPALLTASVAISKPICGINCCRTFCFFNKGISFI